jgi:hypothetical protein
MTGLGVPVGELADMFKVDDGTAVVFSEVLTVEKVDVDGRGGDPVRCQELAEIEIAGVEFSSGSWFPWAKIASGKGPAPRGTQACPLIGTLVLENGQEMNAPRSANAVRSMRRG